MFSVVINSCSAFHVCLCVLSAGGRYVRCYENQVFRHNYLLLGRCVGCNIRRDNSTVIYLQLPAALCLWGLSCSDSWGPALEHLGLIPDHLEAPLRDSGVSQPALGFFQQTPKSIAMTELVGSPRSLPCLWSEDATSKAFTLPWT